MTFKHLNTIAAVLVALCCNAQSPEEFPYFKDYNKLGFNISPVLYSHAKTTREYGDYTLNNYKTFNFNFGFDYLIHPERKWAFKTGLHLDIVPMYNYSYDIKEGDIYEGSPATTSSGKSQYKLNFTIPALVQFKKQMAYNLYFSLETGFHVSIMQEGGFEVSEMYLNPAETEARIIYAMRAETHNPTSIYPNAVISPGFYLMLYGILIQGSVIYQRPVVPFFKGEYIFGNFVQSSSAKGDYKLSGEYLGLSFSAHLRKKHRERPVYYAEEVITSLQPEN